MAAEYESPVDIGTSPEAIARRWLLELSLYEQNMKLWKTQCADVLKKYRGTAVAKNSFNILWANTELLRQAVFQSLPMPDVRRRFKEADPVAKAVGELLQRALYSMADEGKYADQIRMAVFDQILLGRGVTRLRYVPSFAQVGLTGYETEQTETQEDNSDDHEQLEVEENEELAYERVSLEHIQADDFAHGPGKEWAEVQWIGFRHELSRDELEEKFGRQIAYSMHLNDAEITKNTLDEDDPVKELFRSAEVWEIWDRETRRVLFISEGYRDGPLDVLEDPLGLEVFFPIAPPLYCIEDSSSLRPIILYMQYKEQAQQLDRLNTRMNKIIDAIRVRGVYDGTIGELGNLMKAEDNSLIAAERATVYMERGGLANAMWWMPIEPFAIVIQQLSLEAEHCKQVIYELTGLADIMRGASDPDETATAQNLKSQWGGTRLSKLQGTIQSYMRNLYEVVAEIICKKFQPETLAKMTGRNYPSLAEAKQQQLAQLQQATQLFQQAAMQAQAQGQPPPPPPPMPPLPLNWQQLSAFMEDDALRQFKIDIETDVTLGARDQQEMAALKDLILTISQSMQQLMPLVQQQVLPLEAVKELLLAAARRSKLGSSVEDSLEQLRQPPPAPPEGQGKSTQPGMSPEQQMQLKSQELQMKANLEQQKIQAKVAGEQAKIQAQAQSDAQIAELQAQIEMAMEKLKMEMDAKVELIKHQMALQSQEKMAVRENPMPLLGVQ